MGENIGAAARAMLNFGLTDLRIVAPRDGWPNDVAGRMAAGAFDVITPKLYQTLPGALADCHYVFATTTRERGVVKPVFTGRGAGIEALTRTQQGQKIAFLFGRERTGLENDEIGLSHAIVTIPVNPEFYSLNLGQAVLLLSYEWLMAQDETPDKFLPTAASMPAEHEKLTIFLERLEADLEAGGFFKTLEQKPTMQRNIRALFTRADLTEQELRTLHGMIKALKNVQ
jgi:tRNA/rRNA methyltransferase